MITRFLQTDDGIFLRTPDDLKSVSDTLQLGTYTVSVTPGGEFFLVPIEKFERPSRYYGNLAARAKRIMNTFQSRPATTGLLLSGQQGSGKTQMARELSVMAAEIGVPTIIVARPYSGDAFNQFMQRITTPSVIIIDEFEKLYDEDGQKALLTLLDGVYASKKLFVLTCNNVWAVDQHMLNRPGRLFYHLKYRGLDDAFIRDYCAENLKDQSQTAAILSTATLFNHFNFDMLKGLVEEMNRYDISAKEALEMLNIAPDRQDDASFKVEVQLISTGQVIDDKRLMAQRKMSNVNPLTEQLSLYFSLHYLEEINEERVKKRLQPFVLDDFDSEDGGHIYFDTQNLVSTANGQFIFEQGNIRLTLTREREKQHTYYAF